MKRIALENQQNAYIFTHKITKKNWLKNYSFPVGYIVVTGSKGNHGTLIPPL